MSYSPGEALCAGAALLAFVLAGCDVPPPKTHADAGHRGASDGGASDGGESVRDGAPAPPVSATITAVDTGQVAAGTFVEVSGVVLVSPVRSAGPDQKNGCTYDAYVQDPAAPAPAGIRLFVDGNGCTGDAATCACSLGAVSTILDSLTSLGDVYDVQGNVSIFTFDAAPAEHSIYVSQLTKTGSGGAISPVVVTDAGVSYYGPAGTGLAASEGMLVTLAPGAPAAITAESGHAFAFAGARIITEYPSFVDVNGAPFPPAGSRWSSVTGVAWTAYGGAVAPRSPADFVP